MSVVENRYLAGNFGPVTEEVTAFDLPVRGSLPPEINGTLLRNGPNPISPNPVEYHWFTGAGMIHGVALGDGEARWYRNRWVRSDEVAEALGEPPIPGQPADVFIGGRNAANTNIVHHAGRTLATVEVCLPTELDAELNTVGRYDFGGKLRSPMTAHPKMDPVTGGMHFFGYDITGPPFLRYHVVDATGGLVRTEEITLSAPVMVHDFAITESYVIWFDLPVLYDFALLGNQPFPAEWRPEHGARVGVMPRFGGDADIRWFDVELCYVYHPLNAYDDGDGRIVLDVVRHPSSFRSDLNGPAEGATTLDRWTIDLTAGKVIEERLDDRSVEFPRVDERRVGLRHRYGYTSWFGVDSGGIHFGGVVGYDLGKGTSAVWDPGPGRACSEFVMVPRDADAAEDDGWLIGVVYDQATDLSEVAVLPAQDLASGPVATVGLPQRVPFGFHGNWVPAI